MRLRTGNPVCLLVCLLAVVGFCVGGAGALADAPEGPGAGDAADDARQAGDDWRGNDGWRAGDGWKGADGCAGDGTPGSAAAGPNATDREDGDGWQSDDGWKGDRGWRNATECDGEWNGSTGDGNDGNGNAGDGNNGNGNAGDGNDDDSGEGDDDASDGDGEGDESGEDDETDGDGGDEGDDAEDGDEDDDAEEGEENDGTEDGEEEDDVADDGTGEQGPPGGLVDYEDRGIANTTVRGLWVSDDTPTVGQPVNVTVAVENTGDWIDRYEVVLFVDERAVASEYASVFVDRRVNVTFAHTFTEPGEHELRVDDERATVDVQETGQSSDPDSPAAGPGSSEDPADDSDDDGPQRAAVAVSNDDGGPFGAWFAGFLLVALVVALGAYRYGTR